MGEVNANRQSPPAWRPPELSCRLDTNNADGNSHRLCRCFRLNETRHPCLWHQLLLVPSPLRPEVSERAAQSRHDRCPATSESVQAEVRLPDSSISHPDWPPCDLP